MDKTNFEPYWKKGGQSPHKKIQNTIIHEKSLIFFKPRAGVETMGRSLGQRPQVGYLNTNNEQVT